MILCLDPMSIFGIAGRTDVPGCMISHLEKLNAIKTSRESWAEIVDDCPDARRAVKLLSAALGRLSAEMTEALPANEYVTKDANGSIPPVSTSAQNPNIDSLRYSPYFTDQFGLGGYSKEGSDTSPPDTRMENTFLVTLAPELSMTADFNWVSIFLQSK